MKKRMSLSLFTGKPGLFVRASIAENAVTFTVPVENALRDSYADISPDGACFIPWNVLQEAISTLIEAGKLHK